MSMASCISCGDFVDTDDFPEFYDFIYKTKTGYDGHCGSCQDTIRERMSPAQESAYEQRIYGGASCS